MSHINNVAPKQSQLFICSMKIKSKIKKWFVNKSSSFFNSAESTSAILCSVHFLNILDIKPWPFAARWNVLDLYASIARQNSGNMRFTHYFIPRGLTYVMLSSIPVNNWGRLWFSFIKIAVCLHFRMSLW